MFAILFINLLSGTSGYCDNLPSSYTDNYNINIT